LEKIDVMIMVYPFSLSHSMQERTLMVPDPSTWKVLIIDDEPDNVGVATLILEFYKVEVTACTSGAEGLDALRKNRPNFLLLDIQMPKMDGWAVLKAIREDESFKSLTVIAITAHAMVGDKERILAGGFDGYIPKPVNPVTFLDEIRAVLTSRIVT
jgi:CheY-like chemotaxis protein